MFFKVEMWQIRREDVSPLVYVCLMVLKRLVVTVKFFTTRSVTDLASALTYSTVLAIVPIVAVVFAIARGFGFSKYIEVWFRDALSSQYRVCQLVSCTHQGRRISWNRPYLHAVYRVDAYQQHRESLQQHLASSASA